MRGQLNLPSVRAIRDALEEIPGAVRDDDPLPEDAGVGGEYATEILISDPDAGSDPLESLDMPPEGDTDDGTPDEPLFIFEVPPTLTDADLERVLGDDRIGELQRLQQIRSIDALAWYVNFHQRKYQHGVYIRVEGVVLLALQALDKLDMPVERKLELAFHAILPHELFHFAADGMTANWWRLGTRCTGRLKHETATIKAISNLKRLWRTPICSLDSSTPAGY